MRSKSNKRGLRWDRIEAARKRIEEGYYEDPELLAEILSSAEVFNSIQRDVLLFDAIFKCLPGEGDEFRDEVAGLLVRALGPVIDPVLIRKEFPVAGCRGDLDLPIRTEVLRDYPLWDTWCKRYDATRLIVETKNTRKPSPPQHVAQTLGCLTPSSGRLAFLVSRVGFTRHARKKLESIAQRGRELILPLNEKDLRGMADAHERGNMAVMEFLRRKETLLLQGVA